jgi:hypothetical protein
MQILFLRFSKSSCRSVFSNNSRTFEGILMKTNIEEFPRYLSINSILGKIEEQ